MSTGDLAAWMPNLPSLYRGETLYSWCGRVHRHNGNSSSTQTSRILFGVPHAARLHDFPSHLGELARRTGGQIGTGRDFALRHTLLGYFLAFVPLDRANRLLESAIEGGAPHLKMQLGIPASRMGGHHPLKGCRECFREDESRLGWAHWDIEHQLPSVIVCRRHFRPLAIAWDSVTPVHRRAWLLPSSGPRREWFEAPIIDDKQMSALAKLAEFSANAAWLEPGSLDSEHLRNVYKARAAELGALTSAGSIRYPKLVGHLTPVFSMLASAFSEMEPVSVQLGLASIFGSLARRVPRSGHPIKHLVLMAALFDDWTSFRDYRERTAALGRSFGEAKTEVGCSERESRVSEFLSLVTEEGRSIRQAALAVGVTVSTGVRWAKVNGLPFTPRPSRLLPGVLATVRGLLAAGEDKSLIVKRTGISTTSLNRLLSSEPPLHAAWTAARHARALRDNRWRFLRVVTDHPGVPVKRLRSIPGNGYQWLYRHDRTWLIEHLPALWTP